MGRIVDPPDTPAFEIKAHQAVYADGRWGFAFGQFGKEIKELVILRSDTPEGFPITYPPTEISLRALDLLIKHEFDMRAVAGSPDLLGVNILNILTYDLVAEVLLDALQLEDFSYLLLEDIQFILMEEEA